MKPLPILLAALVCAAPSFAADEAVRITGMAEVAAQLNESLCISQRCVEAPEAGASVVAAQPVSGGVELSVRGASGSVLLRERLALREDRRISNADLMRVVSQIHQVIEAPANARAALAQQRDAVEPLPSKGKLQAKVKAKAAAAKLAKAAKLRAAKTVAARAGKRRDRG